jgi:hypothetical protein
VIIFFNMVPLIMEFTWVEVGVGVEVEQPENGAVVAVAFEGQTAADSQVLIHATGLERRRSPAGVVSPALAQK